MFHPQRGKKEPEESDIYLYHILVWVSRRVAQSFWLYVFLVVRTILCVFGTDLHRVVVYTGVARVCRRHKFEIQTA
jgi:hypothetical protein